MAKALIIENGHIFNMLTVLKEVDRHNKQRQFLCQCECGNIGIHKLILLTSEQSKSCGCLRKKTFINRNTSHGKSRTKLNAVWQSMKQRCENPNNANFKHYGGRGIVVCNEWKMSLTVFYDWAIENGYEEGLSIDRKDVNGNYDPINCRWVKMDVQCRNKRDNIFIEYKGENLCLQDWANRLGINISTLNKRLKKWDLDKALSKPKSEINDTRNIRNRK